jgi:Histidine kinase-, DNA gyrase B-, and HSP90-like ATPase
VCGSRCGSAWKRRARACSASRLAARRRKPLDRGHFDVVFLDLWLGAEHQQPDDRPQARGAGIGLYMCQQIVDLHGGHIECTAGNTGGACITVELPVVHSKLTGVDETATLAAPAATEGS